MSELSIRYNAQEIETKWYKHWEEKGYFSSTPDERESYTIVIPPPNVTGVLHMGHMLNNTIQDVLARKARLDGKNVCWVPGTDHASIATEAKVVRKLREQGIKKSDLSRDEFMKYAWEWTEEYGGIILKQLRKLGASCDWERTAFTMDEVRSKVVIKAFVDLYHKDKLYRGLRMVNWDPEAKTVLSNEEVIHSEENSNLYHIKYQIEGTNEYLTIATQRPETIMGDSAVAVHPDDEKYKHLKGKKAIVPLINRAIPIIFDDYVDIEFGTGALKVTPAHDPNDYEIGKRHDLEVIDTLNDDGTLNEKAQILVGVDRFEARKKIKVLLEESGNFVGLEPYVTSIGRSERTNAVVEPKLSLQWYVSMPSLAEPALEAVMTDNVEFFPKKYKNTYRHWMENIRDWCISRQLWWGHRIPAWYMGDEVFVAETAAEALQIAKERTNNPALTIADLRQDEDVLDTWFSSWLWPISVFDGFNNREELDYYYPTSVLVTGWDIIFLWVARMVMAGLEWEDKIPFKHVYFTGMVRDQQRRKMSKSLGNSPDALELLDKFGADGVRFGMLSCSPAGGDLLFEEKLCEQGMNFSNKMWNALRLVKSFEIDDNLPQSETNSLACKWFEQKLNKTITYTQEGMQDYRLSDVLMNLYSFVWNDFCSWYLEMIKPEYGGKIDRDTYNTAILLFESNMRMLHPFMPFITEEIWHKLKDRKESNDCMASEFPTASTDNTELLSLVDKAQQLITNIRDIRNKNGLKQKEPLQLFIEKSNESQALFKAQGIESLLRKLAFLGEISFDAHSENVVSFLSGSTKYHIVINKEIDVEAEKKRLSEELKYAQGFAKSIEKKLSNERFVNNAPEVVVNKEKQKLADGLSRIKILKENLAKL